jgi:uncharacterized glyoxalase superfamily protein PhnB
MTATTTPVISPALRYQDGPAAVDWLVRALGFDARSDHRTPDGLVAHADLRFGTSTIGVSSSAASAPGTPWAQVRHGLYVRVENPDAVHDRARAAGTPIVMPLRDMDYGSRDFTLCDPAGQLWAFGTYDTGATGGEPTLWPELRYPDARVARAWLERALGFHSTLAVPSSAGPDGPPLHVEMRLGPGVVMFGSEWPAESAWADLWHVVHLQVDDPDARFARATAAGAVVVHAPQTAAYGARFNAVRDPEGFVWWISNYRPHGS